MAYLSSILDEAGYLDAKPRGTPWNAYQVSRENELDPAWAALYRRVTGQLMYLANGTRPDISYTVSRLASNMKTPNECDWERTKRALKYLIGTRNVSIVYKRQLSGGDPLKQEADADASYATDKIKGRSTTGYVVHLEGSPIHWKSHLQKTVADSPNAAEYISLYEASVATISIKNLIKELRLPTLKPVIYGDNDGARRLATAGMGQNKARHLMTKQRYVQYLCREGEIIIERVSTVEQPADLLTKGSHTVAAFKKLRNKLNIIDQ